MKIFLTFRFYLSLLDFIPVELEMYFNEFHHLDFNLFFFIKSLIVTFKLVVKVNEFQ